MAFRPSLLVFICVAIVQGGGSGSGSGGGDAYLNGGAYSNGNGNVYRSGTGTGIGSTRPMGMFALRSVDLLANFDSFAFIDMISPRPLLMIAGGRAASLPFTTDAIRRAGTPKELFVVSDWSHYDLYDNVDGHIEKLIKFMDVSLRQK